ncbi:MAG: hypothetical protein IT428_07660 [Planctomycetaceae bacterium]|nr:hypothetical protein [Planctomycetaceae bacterium]
MLSVYRIVPDFNNFRYIMTDDVAASMVHRFDGTSIKDAWVPLPLYLANPMKPEPDIWGYSPYRTVLAVAPKAATELCTFIDQSCEGLPMECDGMNLLLCNVTCVVNALDRKKSKHKEGLPHWIDEYVFHPNRFEYSLFKIPETAMSEVLCVEGLSAPHDEFKGRVEMLGLKGLIFQKLWSGG